MIDETNSIEILERVEKNKKFIEINFSQYLPKKELTILFDQIIEIQNNKDKKNLEDSIEDKELIINSTDETFIDLNYKEINYKIFKKPVIFKLFYEKNYAFKIYLPKLLCQILLMLEYYYSFFIEGNRYSAMQIIDLKNTKKIDNNIIILVPHIYSIFQKLYSKYDYSIFEDMLERNENNLNIEKVLLEPYFLYTEKKAIEGKVGNKKIENLKNMIDTELCFIINKERKKFIDELDNYVKIDIQEEPMMIIGNDGIGKTITLQLYTILESEEYKKIYFNLKLLETYNPRNYLFIELMKAFIDLNNEDFLEYINCVSKFQDIKISDTNKFFEILSNILDYLQFFNTKYIIIFDQFNFDKLNPNVFDNFISNIQIKEKFKIIICCSLIDNENKKNIFIHYKDIQLLRDIEKPKIAPKLIERDNNYKYEEEEKKYKDKIGTKVDNFYFIKNKIEENNKIKYQEEKKNDKSIEQKINSYKIEDKIIKKNNNNINYLHNSNKHPIFDFTSLNLPKLTISYKIMKLYFSNLISLEDMLLKKYGKESLIFKCMSDFAFLPKYYYKFCKFENINKIKEENDINKIIDLFYEEEYTIICRNIKKFFNKLFLENYCDANLYKCLLKLKKSVLKTYENSINLYKLYQYSQKLPFKYVNILMETNKENTNITFDDSLERKFFQLRYSFPYIEKIINKMIEEFSIKIEELSGSVFGNYLEIKIRQNLKELNKDIDIRKVWSLNEISRHVKNEKLKEMEKNSYKAERYKDLEDITKINDIKLSNHNYFYFFPENQINKLFDSLILIKIKNNEFDMISFQITKNKPKYKIKDKDEYSNFLNDKIIPKFKNLYNIKINKIYFWYILSNDSPENESICKTLKDKKIKYLYYSIKDKCFYKERNSDKFNDLKYFLEQESLVIPHRKIEVEKLDLTIDPSPSLLRLFENGLFIKFQENKELTFEFFRYLFFGDNFGPIIKDNLKNNIIKTLKNNISYKNDFKLLFLFGIHYKNFLDYEELQENDELVYLFKYDDNNYIFFKDRCFKIDNSTNLLNDCEFPMISIISNDKNKIDYNKEEIEFSLVKNISSLNSLIYLYKIYYLGEKLLEK